MQLIVTNDNGDSLIIQQPSRDMYAITVQTMEGDQATMTFDRVDWAQLINRIDGI